MLYKMVIAVCIASAAAFSAADEVVSKFEAWRKDHGKAYDSVEAMAGAFAAFSENEKIINEHNAKGLSWTLGHNEFSDLTWDQFRESRMSRIFTNRAPKNMDRVHLTSDVPLAASVDWVAKGAVTPVKNQQRCGSCWAFSTTGSVEGAYQIATGKLISLSEENLVQCDHNGDQGCSGGLMDNAFEWIQENGGICTEQSYPYTSGSGTTGTCTKSCSPVVTVSGHKDVPKGDEKALLSAVASQPVSIAIEADKSAFQLYKSGVLDSTSCGTSLDHGVLIVGYGTDSASGKDYWKVKNSWGATWGEEGYIRMVRDKDMCGVAQQASYPTGAKAAGPAPPSPSPTPPSPSPATHYSDPSGGCLSDEAEISIQGVSGDFCSPKCSFLFHHCPSDVPSGVTATPQCALQDASSGSKYCALICSPTADIKDQKAADAQCGANASCKSIQGQGICTYDA